MGFSLASKDDEISLNWVSYGSLLKLAYKFGWKPKGTRLSTWIVDEMVEASKKQFSFKTTFTFALEDPDFETYDHFHYSYSQLIELEKQAFLKNPEAYFDLTDVSEDSFDTHRIYERPFRVVKVIEERLKLRPILVHEEVMADWDGGYFSNDFQIIDADDSLEIAKALHEARKKGHDGLDYPIKFFKGGAIWIS